MIAVAMSLFSFAGPRPTSLGTTDGKLTTCPSSPNCVSSDADGADAEHSIAPLTLADVNVAAAWKAARDTVAGTARTVIVTEEEGYLHAESTSALMGYVDDLELDLRASDGIIAVRSASRVGHSDLGANRKRVEALREALAEQGVLID